MCSCLRRVLVGAPRWVLGLCSDTLLDQRTSHTSASHVPHAPNMPLQIESEVNTAYSEVNLVIKEELESKECDTSTRM